MTNSIGLAALFARGRPSFAEVAAHVARLDDAAPPVAAILSGFDDLADDSISSIPELMTHVFGRLGFRGNTENYYEQANSYLHRVLDSRLGIPISLSVVVIELGRRCGIELEPIGMPAHLLLAAGTGDDRRWFDPMAGGRSLTLEQVQALFASLVPDVVFDMRYLDPIGPADVATRMLNNLRGIEFRRGDLRRLSNVVAAQVEVPDVPVAARIEFAQLFASRGHFAAAVQQFEALIELDPERAGQYAAAARRLAANFN